MFKVNNKYLLLIAAIVWMIAGFNVLRIGIISYQGNLIILNIIISSIIFYLFWFKIFNKLVKKNTYRIKSYNEPQNFWKFFEKKSYIIMVFMILLGITLRISDIIPVEWIGVFYVGLGSGLSLAGLKFLYNYFLFTTNHKSKIGK